VQVNKQLQQVLSASSPDSCSGTAVHVLTYDEGAQSGVMNSQGDEN
jgi:hypothetical protein